MTPTVTEKGSRPQTSSSSNSRTRDAFERRVEIWVHDEQFSKEDVVINLDVFPHERVKAGDLMAIIGLKTDMAKQQALDFSARKIAENISGSLQPNISATDRKSSEDSSSVDSRRDLDLDRRYLFVVKDMTPEMKAKYPHLEISVAKHIGDAFNFKRHAGVFLTTENAAMVTASHVELSFKDEYLARSDMWRLTMNELSKKTVYKGQKIVFIGTIKAQVTSVYVSGKKVRSAFFSTITKPVFRSESARFVLFIQMSREMWDFDSEGSGEIMFTKVVNGFLPALFKRWVALKARHLVSIVMFTRVEYDTGITSELVTGPSDSTYHTGIQSDGARKPYKDFYRVVVSEMASGEWTTILSQLKREFRYFRHDISMHRLNTMLSRSKDISTGIGKIENEELGDEKTERGMGSVPGTRIEAEPTLAVHGNLLEAINLASTQYSHDYIDRDLVRTGISIVVITPGAGLFEVDYETLRITTETLVSNGIGIDLVCLPKIPLHSVPLFRYRNPQYLSHQDGLRVNDLSSLSNTPQQGGALFGSFSSRQGSLSPSKPAEIFRNQRVGILTPKKPPDQWSFAMPHWLDVSFWTGASQDLLSRPGAKPQIEHQFHHEVVKKSKDFAVRCKMYELEMSSISNDGTVEISVAPLPHDICPQQTIERSQRLLSTELVVVLGLKRHAALSEPVLGPARSILEKKSTGLDKDILEALDAYDEKVALLSELGDKTHSKSDPRRHVRIGEESSIRQVLADDNKVFGTSYKEEKEVQNGLSLAEAAVSARKKQEARGDEEYSGSRKGSMSSAVSSLSTPPAARPAKISRKISLGNRGFGIAAPKAAVAELHTENANAPRASNSVIMPIVSSSMMAGRLLSPSHQEKILERPSSSQSSLRSSSHTNQSSGSEGEKALPSRPITIKHLSISQGSQDQYGGRSMLGSVYEDTNTNRNAGEMQSMTKLKSSDSLRASKSKLLSESLNALPAVLSPTTALSPWLTVLNPSNPSVGDNITSQYKRWQHVFPRPLVTKAMKWKSLCSPASVPLTTEYFPTKSQLNMEYQQKPYTVSPDAEEELNEEPKTREEFLRELISLRLSHGFQIVVGSAVAEAFGQKSMKIGNPFDRDSLAEDGYSVFLSMGNTIHQLSCVNGEVEVNMFLRKVALNNDNDLSDLIRKYKPAISTTLDNGYGSTQLLLGVPKDEYNWNYVDSYIAGQNEEMTEGLRFWRARFVLIPVEEQNLNHRRRGEDNEEETRLEGIRALTQMWQRHRCVPPSERQYHSLASRKRKDPNPLDIVYQTQDPSVVVNAELETLTSVDTGEVSVRRGQLLSDSEPFRKANLNIPALIEAIQAPVEKGGVRMQNRRWHLRLHYNCFIGSDMTTWLLENFEDIETRQEAEDLGNILMAKDEERKARDKEHNKDGASEKEKEKDTGIFVHVEKRHPFRDGQYFYQVTSEFAKPRPETRGGWGPFASRRRDTSVPSTPMTETATKDSPKPERTRSSSGNDEKSSNSGNTTPTISGSRKPKVALSKVMKYDVDPRKRSYRPEIMNLHYDRLHNPDNCYHIRIDWMNVTAKLIEDAIQSWATTAERYGLRLIEVPIGEARTITERHPFRSPYMIELAATPPAQQPLTYFDATSLTPQVSTSRHYYQRAILKKFNFVLDVEAAQSFPANVEVTYSWGRPDYKYSQYIHRSGVLLIQITDEGNFLLLANKLYNNRASASREQEKFKSDWIMDRPLRVSTGVNNPSSLITPNASPMLRPTVTSPPIRATPDVLPSVAIANSKLATIITPDSINEELEAFCHNAALLEDFYKEVLEKATPPAATPPTFQRAATLQGTLEQIGNIPALGLPPGLVSRETSPSPMRLANVPSGPRRHASVAPALDTASGTSHDGLKGNLSDG